MTSTVTYEYRVMQRTRGHRHWREWSPRMSPLVDGVSSHEGRGRLLSSLRAEFPTQVFKLQRRPAGWEDVEL